MPSVPFTLEPDGVAGSMKHDEHSPFYSPPCGTSDQRNEEYTRSFSVRRFFDHLVTSAEPTILDVGGHRGESIRFFKSIYPQSSLFSFEPDPDNFAELEKVARQFDTQAIQVALGEKEEECSYYRQSISHMGGLLPINTGSVDSLGYARRAINEKVPIHKVTLDSICSGLGIGHVNILKIDVQGYESKVLEGASSVLARTDCAVIEIGLYDFYGKTRSFVEVVRRMDEMDFSLWDISKLSKNPRNFRTDWIEVVYRKNGK